MNKDLIKILGIVASAIGMGATLLADWVSDRKIEEKIDEKVREALAKQDEEES